MPKRNDDCFEDRKDLIADEVESVHIVERLAGHIITRFSVWKVDTTAGPDPFCQDDIFVKLIEFENVEGKTHLRLTIQAFKDDADIAIRRQTDLSKFTSKDFQTVAECIANGPVVPDSRKDWKLENPFKEKKNDN